MTHINYDIFRISFGEQWSIIWSMNARQVSEIVPFELVTGKIQLFRISFWHFRLFYSTGSNLGDGFWWFWSSKFEPLMTDYIIFIRFIIQTMNYGIWYKPSKQWTQITCLKIRCAFMQSARSSITGHDENVNTLQTILGLNQTAIMSSIYTELQIL